MGLNSYVPLKTMFWANEIILPLYLHFSIDYYCMSCVWWLKVLLQSGSRYTFPLACNNAWAHGGFVFKCLFRCKARWSDLAKLRSHCVHLKGLIPVCFLWCRVNSSDLANFQVHPSQAQLKGFSPVCVLAWAFR